MTLQIHQFPCLSDNYGFLIHDPASGETAAIDTPDGKEYLQQADAKGWTITQIWNTHWHPDHAGGNKDIIAATSAKVIAPQEVKKLSEIDQMVSHGDSISLGGFTAHVIDVSGHTNGHIAFHIPEAGVAFVGDSVFALGCGRMFEGEPKQFWESLSRIKALPPETMLYCAHEYTLANAEFAVHADPENKQLQAYAALVVSMRNQDEPTVPTQLARELETNPFLRADDPAIMAKWGGDAPHETFAALRAAKDNF
ncbi:hydroxyacylglutathione hydrolase [Altererythrobacter sp.]|uniref:hydroxyacylglutathione hydrolase n=1 Tax=Altererythrobacter sp. TaxID=1872480 RepID=UPI001AFFE03A|nr:hydroxyacylglutathione hydrolase [Altererythrobacter sp.]MBO6608108.1 hydroxyacylglutathione hydrolase [Altererythrobacter sp.]MBO6641636.1 hydroxyacylglutathione hydrolase [Altererythrobacter sp.]MBO6707665.1 hydroxyacylglutathione hydrolase [Altererythrobacter sp.]